MRLLSHSEINEGFIEKRRNKRPFTCIISGEGGGDEADPWYIRCLASSGLVGVSLRLLYL